MAAPDRPDIPDLAHWLAADQNLTSRLTSTLADGAPTTTAAPDRPDDEDLTELVPDDAGTHADGLAAILARIPRQWGRWIACGPGWHRLLVDLDQTLALIEPGYIVQQAKEKFGGLRYYWTLPDLNCCAAVDDQIDDGFPPRPAPYDDHDGYVAWHAEHGADWRDAHDQAHTRHADDPAHQQAAAHRAHNRQLMDGIVTAAERQAARTCELTGNPGILIKDGHWYRTCDPLAAPAGSHVAAGVDPDQVARSIDRADGDPDQLAALARELADRCNRAADALQHVIDQQERGRTTRDDVG